MSAGPKGRRNGFASLSVWADEAAEAEVACEAEAEAMLADVTAPAPGAENAGSDKTQEETKMAPQPATQDTPLPPGSELRDAEEL
jgi:hypothetical protein